MTLFGSERSVIFFSSKQLIGGGTIHVLNIVAALVSRGWSRISGIWLRILGILPRLQGFSSLWLWLATANMQTSVTGNLRTSRVAPKEFFDHVAPRVEGGM